MPRKSAELVTITVRVPVAMREAVREAFHSQRARSAEEWLRQAIRTRLAELGPPKGGTPAAGVRQCVQCGCTHDRACVEACVPCGWVSDQLCTACATGREILRSQSGRNWLVTAAGRL